VLTLDLALATQILMQLAVRDIGQLTDIQELAGARTPVDPAAHTPFLLAQAHMPTPGTAADWR
jgi:hypothetical protein